jgi:hypothetical protein
MELKPESDLSAQIEKYLSHMMSFVGNDGYGRSKKSVNAYRNRLGFYLRFCTERRIADVRLGDYDHLMEYVGWLSKQTKRNQTAISDRYVFNIFATLGTFALSLDVTLPVKKTIHATAASPTTPTLPVLVIRIGVSTSPLSSTQ